jgi:predicted DNA-binding transcriptional regulator AlpA
MATAIPMQPVPAIASLLLAEKVVSLSTIAKLLGCDRGTAWRYTKRDDFPEPLATLPIGKVWETRAVEKWAARTLPLQQGRPQKKRKRN